MKILIALATIITITASAQAQSWSFSLGEGIGFSYGNSQPRYTENNLYYTAQHNTAYQHTVYQSYSYVTPPVFVKTDLDKPPVIMQRVVTHGNPNRDCGPYPNRW